jgi:predicted amidohydrolase YtcJ
VQPYHLSDDGRWADTRIGSARAKYTYAFRSFLDAGVSLALGSDWWVAPIDPLSTIWSATTRQTLDGRHPGGWIPEQKITVGDAVHAYTVGAAYASGEEEIKGSIECGKLADLAVLSEDIFNTDPASIRDVQVDLTVFDGRVIYERS